MLTQNWVNKLVIRPQSRKKKSKVSSSSPPRPIANAKVSDRHDGNADEAAASTPPPPGSGGKRELSLRTDLLASIRADVAAMIKMELRATVTEDLNFIKSKLQVVQAKLVSTAAGLRAELGRAGSADMEMKYCLSSHLDEIERLRGMVVALRTEIDELKNCLKLWRSKPDIVTLELINFLSQQVNAHRLGSLKC